MMNITTCGHYPVRGDLIKHSALMRCVICRLMDNNTLGEYCDVKNGGNYIFTCRAGNHNVLVNEKSRGAGCYICDTGLRHCNTIVPDIINHIIRRVRVVCLCCNAEFLLHPNEIASFNPYSCLSHHRGRDRRENCIAALELMTGERCDNVADPNTTYASSTYISFIVGDINSVTKVGDRYEICSLYNDIFNLLICLSQFLPDKLEGALREFALLRKNNGGLPRRIIL